MERRVKNCSTEPIIKGWLSKKIHGLARFLQNRMLQVSWAGQKRLLLIYCATAISISAGVSYWSVTHPVEHAVEVAPIRVLPVLPSSKSAMIITNQEYQRIHNWRLQLDSIEGLRNQPGHHLPSRDGSTLRDTLLYLEDLYHQQFK